VSAFGIGFDFLYYRYIGWSFPILLRYTISVKSASCGGPKIEKMVMWRPDTENFRIFTAYGSQQAAFEVNYVKLSLNDEHMIV
jgi:hypothetical protein